MPRPPPQPPAVAARKSTDDDPRYETAKRIFKPLEDYILEHYGRFECLNASFDATRPRPSGRTHSESAIRTTPPLEPHDLIADIPADYSSQIDAKTLLLGDVAENGDWWTGRLERNYSERIERQGDKTDRKKGIVSTKSPSIDWERVDRWYDTVHSAGQSWWQNLDNMDVTKVPGAEEHVKGSQNAQQIEADLIVAREHTERALLKSTEVLLKRPGRPLTEPENVRFLILVLLNPSLYPSGLQRKLRSDSARPWLDRAPLSVPRAPLEQTGTNTPSLVPSLPLSPSKAPAREPGQHAGILKRVLGLLANSSDSCHRYMIAWFSRMPEPRFTDLVDLVASFVTYRLSKRKARPQNSKVAQDGGLIPDLSGSRMHTSAQLQAAIGLSGGVKKREDEGVQSVIDYSEDWQLRAAAKIMALLFAANNIWHSGTSLSLQQTAFNLSRPRAKTHGQLLPTSGFYNTLLDYCDLIADFKAWESKKAKFTFCQYPFFLSVGAKIRILEYDARRQMENKAREAYFDNVTSGKHSDVNFNLHVRRECVVDDSLRLISEAVGGGPEELKKGLRVKFTGEEGIDAGGLRKEWFLVLVRDIFDPDHGM